MNDTEIFLDDFYIIPDRPPTVSELAWAEESHKMLVNAVRAPEDWTDYEVFDLHRQRGFVAGYLAGSRLKPSPWMMVLLVCHRENPKVAARTHCEALDKRAKEEMKSQMFPGFKPTIVNGLP